MDTEGNVPNAWELNEEDLANPEMVYWTSEREQRWSADLLVCLNKHDLRQRRSRYYFCMRLNNMFQREGNAALSAGSYMGALILTFHLETLLQDRYALFSDDSYQYDPRDETPAALRDGLTLEALDLLCLEKAEEILRTASDASKDLLWKGAAWMCIFTYPSDRFRGVLWGAPWTEKQRAQLLDAMKTLDIGFIGVEDGKYDPEPYCPPYPMVEPSELLYLIQTHWGERVQNRYRMEHRKWLDWRCRNKPTSEYRQDLEEMAARTLWTTVEDMRELRRLSTEEEWASALARIQENPHWKERWEAVEQIQREIPPSAPEKP